MSRVVKPEKPYHSYRAIGKDGSEVVLVGRGRRTYLWIGNDLNKQSTIHLLVGDQCLRELARTILRVIPVRKYKKGKAK